MQVNKAPIFDTFERKHDYLRISLTERCNLRCFYCMPEEGIPLREKAVFMTSEETIELARIFVELGVKKIRLTGGEPLIKKDIANIIQQLGQLPVELTLTTNAILVDRYIETFQEAGIQSINVSMDSLKAERFNAISRRSYFDRIMTNIELLLVNNFKTKVNVVLIKDVNDKEVVDFIEWTENRDVEVRFIEFMPFDGNNWNWSKKVTQAEIIEKVEAHFGAEKLVSLPSLPNDTSRHYQIDGFKGKFGIISTLTNPFCDSCNRIRLTADGKIKNCLFSSEEVNLLQALRKGKDVEKIIRESILAKKHSRAGIQSFEDEKSALIHSANRSMTTIGG